PRQHDRGSVRSHDPSSGRSKTDRRRRAGTALLPARACGGLHAARDRVPRGFHSARVREAVRAGWPAVPRRARRYQRRRGRRGLPAESLTVRVPAWAARAEVDVEMPREQWNRFTDFGVTVFDSSGQQVSEGPLNYAVGRQRFDVPEGLAGRPLTVELFPASAQVGPAPSWQATVRVRFLLKEPRAAQVGKDATVVAGGRTTLELLAPPALQAPAGFQPLVEVRVTPSAGEAAILRAPLEHP